jgi:hypothetical protein
MKMACNTPKPTSRRILLYFLRLACKLQNHGGERDLRVWAKEDNPTSLGGKARFVERERLGKERETIVLGVYYSYHCAKRILRGRVYAIARKWERSEGIRL